MRREILGETPEKYQHFQNEQRKISLPRRQGNEQFSRQEISQGGVASQNPREEKLSGGKSSIQSCQVL